VLFRSRRFMEGHPDRSSQALKATRSLHQDSQSRSDNLDSRLAAIQGGSEKPNSTAI
jgi:hypothetical protein